MFVVLKRSVDMKYFCANCERFFDEEDADCNVYRQYIDGVCVDKVEYGACPNCGSEDIREAVECAICGEWYADGKQLTCGVCKECLEAAITPENAWRYSKEEGEMTKIMVSVPDIVADNFERREIVAMIHKAFCELKDDPRIAEYCWFDKESFADFCANIAK